MRLLSALTLFYCGTLFAGSVTLIWPPFDGPMAGYRVFVGAPTVTNTAEFAVIQPAAFPRATIDLPAGTYRAGVAVVGTNGVVSPLTFTTPFMVQASAQHRVSFEGALDPAGPWREIQSTMISRGQFGDMRFFRVRIEPALEPTMTNAPPALPPLPP